ncbi:MAG TPA: alpha-glucosidase C-terminal domain-containing protein, partial [Terriglobia bacterium]|nr:alpha-glucosidase C-terminal domain-containing protein [Terriglobia bacterium]
AEANQWPSDVRAYFGQGDECHVAFHFPLMPRMFMAVRLEDRKPIIEIMEQTPPIPETCQWGTFLRNHDELTLEMVTDVERDYLYDEYAKDRIMRVNVGIRRRLAPLMENDRRRIELLNGMLLSLPGSPIVYYGDEIGMGDNIYLGDRNGVRTPMQWNGGWNAGFSTADPELLYMPLVSNPIYGYQGVNVESQRRSLNSLLSWMKRIIKIRKSSRVFSRGSLEFLKSENHQALAYIRELEQDKVLVVNNLSSSAQAVELDLGRFEGFIPIEMFGGNPFPRVNQRQYLLTLGPYQFFWFKLRQI